MSEPVFFISHFAIKEDALEDLKGRTGEVMQRLREEKPRTVLFLSYLDEEGGRISFLHAFSGCRRVGRALRGRGRAGRSRVRVHRTPRVGVVRTDERAGDGGYASNGGEVRRPIGG